MENNENNKVVAIITVILSPGMLILLTYCVSTGTTSSTQNYSVNWFIVTIRIHSQGIKGA